MSDYQLDALGWYQFERMCQALLRSRHGAALEAWGGSQDLGRDAYSDGPLNYPHKDVSEPGPFLFQVKFVSAANAAGAKSAPALLRAVRLEASQILDRIADEVWVQPRFYTLLTNVPLNASLRDDVKTILGPVMPGSQILINGAKDIDSMLDSDPGIRLSYPQVLGLRDLEALLTRAVARPIVQRSSFSLEEARRLAPVYVPTEAYNQAISLLARSGFAVLLGPPEMGKTATARMITLAKHCAGWEAYECRNPNDLFTAYARWRPQVFLADDAFGSTEYRPELAEEWAADLGRIIDLADESHWVLWTSRPAPLRQGLRQLHLQGSASKFPSPGEVEVDAAQLSVTEKSLILYRHAKAQHLSTDGTKLIRRFAREIVNSKYFTPLRIQRFVRDELPSILEAPPRERPQLVREAVIIGLQQPTSAMSTSFEVLDPEHKAVLVAMLNSPGGPIRLERLAVDAERYLGSTPTLSVELLVHHIDDHFVRVRARP
jgi:hypothetical protein